VIITQRHCVVKFKRISEHFSQV